MHEDSVKSTRRVTLGKVLVGTAVLAPAALVVGVYPHFAGAALRVPLSRAALAVV